MSKTQKDDKEIENLKAKLAEMEAENKALKEAEAKAPKPSGVKISISLEDYKKKGGKGIFPAEGSDGKGNLVKFVKKEEVQSFESQGWKASK